MSGDAQVSVDGMCEKRTDRMAALVTGGSGGMAAL